MDNKKTLLVTMVTYIDYVESLYNLWQVNFAR